VVKPVEFAEYFSPTPISFWTTLQEIGVTKVISELNRTPDGMHDDTGDRPWDLTVLARVQQLYADAGLELVGIEDYPPLDRARTGSPGADEEIEWFCTLIRNMGTLGIPMLCYNWMPGANWLRTSTIARGRGGARVTAFRASALPDDRPMKIGTPDAETLWAAYERFVGAVVPVAERSGVRLALHPDDPPIPSYRGAARIMISVENFERALAIADSEAHALCFCQGNITLVTDDVPGAIRHLGDRIAFGHFRDVRGTPESFEETFHDEGQTDMRACMDAWHEIGFEGVLRPDHVPTLQGEAMDSPSYALLGRLHAIGYMQGLREASVHHVAEAARPERGAATPA
jgi:mannonate dehydratase